MLMRPPTRSRRLFALAAVFFAAVLSFVPNPACGDPSRKISAETVLTGLRDFYRKTARPDGSFRPGENPAYAGMEIQLIDDVNWPGKLQSWQHTGSIYNVVPAAKIANRPVGEWNQMRIVANGQRILVEQNGAKLVDANLEEYVKEHAKRHPGLLRKGGHIGLQSYNTRVEFRNLYLKPL